MENLRAKSGLLGVRWSGQRLDIGSPQGLLQAAASVLDKRWECEAIPPQCRAALNVKAVFSLQSRNSTNGPRFQ